MFIVIDFVSEGKEEIECEQVYYKPFEVRRVEATWTPSNSEPRGILDPIRKENSILRRPKGPSFFIYFFFLGRRPKDLFPPTGYAISLSEMDI